MNNRQKIVFLSPFVLLLTTYLIFQLWLVLVGAELAWYLGLMTYWIIWGLIFSIYMIGKDNLKEMVHPQKPDLLIILIVLIPLVLAAIWRFSFSMSYTKTSIWVLIGLIIT